MKNLLLFCLLYLTCCSGYAQLNENVGIGVRLQIDSGRGYKLTKVIALVPNGAAQLAGLQPDDFILKVDGITTRDVALDKVVAMIVGEEGTAVKLEIERNGAIRTYSIPRAKYKYASNYYLSAVKNDAFCTALVTLMNDAGYGFENVIDTLHYTDRGKKFSRRYYDCKVKIPGAKKVSIMSSFGNTGYVDFGNFETTADVNAAGQEIIAQIKTCFPDYYYNATQEKDGTFSVNIGKEYKDGYESAILTLSYYLEDETQTYTLFMYINAGKTTRFYTITQIADESSFGNAVRTIFKDVPNKYRNVKGTEHQMKGGLFSAGSWYDIVPLPDGAHDCTLSEGTMSLSNGCACRFYLGESREDAAAAYKKIFVAMRNALGRDFVYTTDKQELDMTIPKDVEGVVTFGIKKKRAYESLPLASLVLFKTNENKYAVNILFHEFGM